MSKCIAASKFQAACLALQVDKTPVTWVISRRQLLDQICMLAQAFIFSSMSVYVFPKQMLIGRKAFFTLFCSFTFIKSVPMPGEMHCVSDCCMGVKLSTYLWTSFQGPFAVCVKAAVDWSFCASKRAYRQPSPTIYVGSTSVTVAAGRQPDDCSK